MGMMKYVESLLGKNEQILWRARQHWIVLTANFVINLFIFIVVLAVYGATGTLGAGAIGDFIVDIGGSEGGSVGVAETFLVESAFDSTLAIGELLGGRQVQRDVAGQQVQPPQRAERSPDTQEPTPQGSIGKWFRRSHCRGVESRVPLGGSSWYAAPSNVEALKTADVPVATTLVVALLLAPWLSVTVNSTWNSPTVAYVC